MKKIEVCVGATCIKRKSEEIFDYLEKEYEDSNIQVNRCSCLGHCQKDPNVLVDEEKIFHYTKKRTVKNNIEKNIGSKKFSRFDTEEKLNLSDDFLGDL